MEKAPHRPETTRAHTHRRMSALGDRQARRAAWETPRLLRPPLEPVRLNLVRGPCRVRSARGFGGAVWCVMVACGVWCVVRTRPCALLQTTVHTVRAGSARARAALCSGSRTLARPLTNAARR
jgi:hypothetical protein